jgi:hypothetical protein
MPHHIFVWIPPTSSFRSSTTISMSSPQISTQTDPNIMEGPQKCHPPPHFAKDEDPVILRKKPKPIMANRSGKSAKVKTGQQVAVEQASDLPQPCTHAQPSNQSHENPCESSDEERSHSVTYVNTQILKQSMKVS